MFSGVPHGEKGLREPLLEGEVAAKELSSAKPLGARHMPVIVSKTKRAEANLWFTNCIGKTTRHLIHHSHSMEAGLQILESF